MRKISKIKNLSGLLDLASIPLYLNGGEQVIERTLPEIEVYGDQLRKDLQRTGLTYDELSNLNYGAQRLSQIQQREKGVKELAYSAPVTGDVLSLYDVGKDIYEGNYGKAAIGAGLFFIPNILENSLRYLYRKGRNVIKYINAGKRYDEAIRNSEQVSLNFRNKQDTYQDIQIKAVSDQNDLNSRARQGAFGNINDYDIHLPTHVTRTLNQFDNIEDVSIKSRRKEYSDIDRMSDDNFKRFLTKDVSQSDLNDIYRLIDENMGVDDLGYRYLLIEDYLNPYLKNIIQSLNIRESIPVFRTELIIEPLISINPAAKITRRRLSIGEDVDVYNKGSIENTMIDVPKTYQQAVQDNIAYVKERFPGFSPFGSSVGAAYNRFPHVSGDIDGYITDTDFADLVLSKIDKSSIQDIRDGNTYRVDLFNGKFGHSGEVDFNIIKTDPNTGLAVGQNAEELFRQFFPDEYRKAYAAQFDGKPFVVNKTPQELILAANPSTKTILDSFEIDFRATSKNKHAGRAMAYISYADPNSVNEGIRAFGKSLVGNKVRLAPQFDLAQLSDVDKNLKILEKLLLPIDNTAVARDPRKMQNALDYWYLNLTIRSRGTDANNLLTGVTNSLELDRGFRLWNYEGTGGTAMGAGLNTVVLGNSGALREAYGHIQASPRRKLNQNSPEEFIDSVERFIGGPNYKFTESEKDIINKILLKYGIKLRGDYDSPQQLLLNEGMPNRGRNVYDALSEISNELDMPYITRSATYGNSYYSSIIRDIDLGDAVSYGGSRNIPPSLLSRKLMLETKSSNDDLSKIEYAIGKAHNRGILNVSETDKEQFNLFMRRIRNISKMRIDKKRNPTDFTLYDAYLKNKQLEQEINRNASLSQYYEDAHSKAIRRTNKLINKRERVDKNTENLIKFGVLGSATAGTGYVLYRILDNDTDDVNSYSEGGIHIKKKNRGKFTETMKRTGKTAEELKHSKNPLTRKRAIFAINSRKFNHK